MSAPETYRSRLRQYKRRESLTIWVGAGFAGLIAIATSDTFGNLDVPRWLLGILIALSVGGAAFVGCARVKFEWAATQIERRIEDEEVTDLQPLPDDERRWPDAGERFWAASLYVLLAAGLLLVFCALWPWPPSDVDAPGATAGAAPAPQAVCVRCDSVANEPPVVRAANPLWPLAAVCVAALIAGALLMLCSGNRFTKVAGAATILFGLGGPAYLIRDVKFSDLFKLQLQFRYSPGQSDDTADRSDLR